MVMIEKMDRIAVAEHTHGEREREREHLVQVGSGWLLSLKKKKLLSNFKTASLLTLPDMSSGDDRKAMT